MRLIDADALREALRNLTRWVVKNGEKHNEGFTYDQVFFCIDARPTVDAVPVVRCKDCKWWKLSEYNTYGIYVCKKRGGVMGEHDFCSRGERKVDETENVSDAVSDREI